MKKTLRLLLLEDSEIDEDLILRELNKGGYEVTSRRVDTAKGFTEALDGAEWDLVICDHFMPGFGSAEALELLKAKGANIPAVVVSGAAGEEIAVKVMKAGANDYILKSSLFRLVPSVDRELREAENRRSRLAAEQAARRGEVAVAYLAAIVESSDDAIIGLTLEGVILSWNSGAQHIYGYTAEEMKGQLVTRLVPPYRPEEWNERCARVRDGQPIQRYETVRLRKDGATVDVSIVLSPIRDQTGQVIGVSSIERDITVLKREEEQRLLLIDELTMALASIRTLRGLLPICASCKKIRDDRGYWQKVESYITQHTEAEFTHGICPDCVHKLYPEYDLHSEPTSKETPTQEG